jgi:hypothetical protein
MNKPSQDCDVWFRDVTEDPEACRAADDLPELRTRFENLGFRRVGFLGEYWLPGEAPCVHEVLSSADGGAFLTLALAPDHPLRSDPRTLPTAILESSLEDGSIIITTTYPEHLWRLDHPKAGVYLEGWREAAPEELWGRHQQRVEDLALERDSSVLLHVSMPFRLWIAQRCNEVGNYVALVALLMGVVAFVGVLIPLVQLKDWLDAWARVWFGAFWPLVWFVSTLALVVAGMWMVRLRVVRGWLVGQWLARRLPWPRRRRYDAMKEADGCRTSSCN